MLSMVAYGTGGSTFKEMQSALHLPKDEEAALHSFQELLNLIRNQTEDVVFRIVNRIYVVNSIDLQNKYKKLIKNSFHSEIHHIDVNNPHESVNLINSWVANSTEHKINETIETGSINADTQMVLLNAIYFKGAWKHSFMKKATENRIFHVDENRTVEVPTMFNYKEYFVGQLKDLKAKFIILPYKDSDLNMIIILPNQINGLANIINNFALYNLSRIFEAGTLKKTFLYLPQFKIESSIQLENPLRRIGMTEIFSIGANFSEISGQPLLVSKVVQKIFIDVNEEGTEAAAASVSLLVPYSFDPDESQMIINKPFLFEIIDTRNELTLFVGTITNPKQ